MVKKILLGLAIILILIGVTLFLLDFIGIFTFGELQNEALDWASNIPIAGDFIGYRERNQRLQRQITGLEYEIRILHDDNQELVSRLENAQEENEQYQETIEQLEEELETREGDIAQRKKKVNRLANIYAEMNPQNVVGIMEEMDMGLVIDVLDEMSDQNAAEIFELMPNDMAAEVSRRLSNIVID